MNQLSLLWHIRRASLGSRSNLDQIQQSRLMELASFARQYSPFYGQLYQHTRLPLDDLGALPPITKTELMDNFDAWSTNPELTRDGVEAFLADKLRIGHLFLDRYSVWTTSGTSGYPGIFIHDMQAQSVYNSLILARAYTSWLTPWQLLSMIRQGFRYVFIIATGDHFAAISNWERIRHSAGKLSAHLGTLSVLTPLPEMVKQLNAVQPTVLASYPSTLALLAGEQAAGRLNIHPLLMTTSGEWSDPVLQAQIEAAFEPARLFDIYGASEFPYIAFECRQNWLHVNADWLVLEPVDEDYLPVPAGRASHTVLLTNLANRVQPVIRYELGDRITVKPDPCPCGSSLPAIRVEGRRDEILTFYTPDGTAVKLSPMALATVVETTAGVHRFQLIQTSLSTLSVRLETDLRHEERQVWGMVAQRLKEYLAAQGLPFVKLEKAHEAPQPDPTSGKFRQVWSVVGTSVREGRGEHVA